MLGSRTPCWLPSALKPGRTAAQPKAATDWGTTPAVSGPAGQLGPGAGALVGEVLDAALLVEEQVEAVFPRSGT
ncbi:MAG: hypothetical protein ACRYG7_01670 [Janthinobacterium lividum]